MRLPPTPTRRDAISAAFVAAAFSTPSLPAFAGEIAPASGNAAIFANRFSIAGTISPVPPLGQYSRYEDQLSTSKGSKALSLTVKFDFPQQFQQIGRALGGIQFVDGNSGLKVYVLKAPLPEDTALETISKKWIGESVFSPNGQIAREGVEIDAYKVTSAKVVEAPGGAEPSRRRFSLKYTVITPANQRATDRFAFVEAYESEGVAYMLLASAGATKWEGGEKERCERIAESFFIGRSN